MDGCGAGRSTTLAAMSIPTEPIGSIPRPADLLNIIREHAAGRVGAETLERAYDAAVRDTIERFEATGSPVITDGEQRKSSFATYPLEGLKSLAGDGVVIPFKDGHTRQLPRLTAGPFRYGKYAGEYVGRAKAIAKRPLKQAVISASALSLLYPASGIEGYPRQKFINDLVAEAAADISSALESGAEVVQIDFTEGRLSLKLDPSGGLLKSFVDLNNRVLERFDAGDRARIGVHVCPGGDHDSTHSADVDYEGLLSMLFETHAGRFYLQLSSERDRPRVLKQIAERLGPEQRVFVGVTDPILRRIESPEAVCERVLEAAKYLPLDRLGTTDDCGFSPFADDDSTARDVAFAKIRARVEGTQMAAAKLGFEKMTA
jgi:5-methyltetrahydropteroyltriglutamate--homocysteine methyltransferase